LREAPLATEVAGIDRGHLAQVDERVARATF